MAVRVTRHILDPRVIELECGYRDICAAIAALEAVPAAPTLIIPTDGSWRTDHAEAGTASGFPCYMMARSHTSSNSRAMVFTYLTFMRGCNGSFYYLDWDRPLTLSFKITRRKTDPETVTRYQVKGGKYEDTLVEGQLMAKGIGLEIKENIYLYGEAYDTSRELVDLGVSLTEEYPYEIRIEHEPGVGVRFYVNGVLKGMSTHEPSGHAEDRSNFVASVINGPTGGTEVYMYFTPIKIWQG